MATLDLGKSPQENRNKWIALAICVVFIVIAAKCQGQSLLRENTGNSTTRITTDRSLMFFVFNPKGNADTIFLGLYADSLAVNAYYLGVYVWYPKDIDIKNSRLDVGFDKMGIETLESSFIKGGYVEYKITAEQHNKLKNYKHEYVNFHIDDYDIPFFAEGDYFMRFFKAL